MDENVREELTVALRRRGIDVLTVQEDQRRGIKDPAVLDRAALLGRVVFTNDIDFVREAARRQRDSEPFSGVLFARQRIPINEYIDDLELIASVSEPEEHSEQVVYLPL